MADEEQVARLLRSFEEWNAWRKANRNVVPDLQGANLQGADLQGADLQGADLQRAEVYGAELYGAMLDTTVLADVDLILDSEQLTLE